MLKPLPKYQPSPNEQEEEEDPYITRIRKTGCFKQHEALQDCYYDKKDWRACKEEMLQFKQCFSKYNKHID